MAEEEEEEEESFEAFHVPQQSRRDKLRVTTTLLNPLNPNNTTANHHHHHQVDVDEEEEEEGDIGSGTLGDQSHFHQHHHHGVGVGVGVGRGGVVLHDPSSLLLTTTYTNTSNPLPILGSGSISIGGGPDKHQHPHLDVVMSSVKEEGSAAGNGNLMMNYVNGLFMNNSTTASHHHHHPLFISPNNTHQQPTPTRRVSNPFDLYNLNNFTDFNGGAGAADVVAFRPQPLSFITNNHNDTSRTTTTNTISGQGNLSLSLSSTTTTYDLPYTTSLPLSLPPPLQLNTTIDHPYGTLGGGGVIIIDDTNTGGGASASTSRDVRSLVPLGPFTGYASILKGSKFLKPAKQLLDEFCYVGMGKGIGSIVTPPNSSMDPLLDTINGSSIVDDSSLSCTGPGLSGNSRLISMLDEVYRRYKLYYQQMQAVVASFESVAGLGNAAPYTSFALKAMSKHFSCLKNAITDQLHSNKALDDGVHGKNEAQRVGTDDQWVHGHRPANNLSYFEHQHQPVWRPQRGLPERAVAVLRAWLFEHFLHPYPTDTDKQMLAKQTGLSRSQVSNWFINARVRLWKPMVEEIHMLETCQAHKTSDVENRNSCNPPPTSNPPNYDKQPQTSSVNVQDQTLKRTRDELHDSIPEQVSEPSNFMYNKFLNNRHIGAGVSTSGGNSGVSLTLGLRQNNGIGLSESFPMNMAHQFGLEASNDGYVIGSFEAPPRHFGRDMGGQLFHDFVG